MNRIFELPCLDSRKSFYGKAHVIERDNGENSCNRMKRLYAKLTQAGASFAYGKDIAQQCAM